MDYSLIEMKIHGDARGLLVAVEGGQHIPFDIKRFFFIFDTAPGVSRGCHAHKRIDQFILCAKGGFDITVDNGVERKTIRLDRPNLGIHIRPNVWSELSNFTPGCVVMVLASDHYKEDEYQRDYEKFLRSVGK